MHAAGWYRAGVCVWGWGRVDAGGFSPHARLRERELNNEFCAPSTKRVEITLKKRVAR